MTTRPRISFGLYGLAIKQDSLPQATDLQPFSKIADLRTDNATARPLITYEPNYWLLDGGYKFISSAVATVHVGMMSLSMSDANGYFATPPVLVIDFWQPHTTDGLTLRFMQYSGDWSALFKVQFYDPASVLIREDNYAPIDWEFSTGQAVTNFQRIVITFYATNKGYRYLRLTGIDYGRLIYFEGDQIKTAAVVEEIDPTSAEARYNTFDARLYSADAQFSIINPGGDYASLQQRQPLAVHEIIGNQSVYIGQFYLESWESPSETEIEFHGIDLLGVLDGINYRGDLFTGTPFHTVIENILEPLFVPYDLDPDLYDVPVRGWLPAASVRQTLQQLAFAVGAYVDCSRSASIKIYQTRIVAGDPNYTTTITAAERSLMGTTAMKEMITGVDVTAHSYSLGSASKQLYDGTLAPGTYEITFSEPATALSITGATITQSGVNYAIINVTTTGKVTLTGTPYIDTTQVFSVRMTIDSTIRPKILQIKDATLVNSDNGAAIAQHMYDYHQQRLQQKFKLYAPLTEVGDVALVDAQYQQQIRGMIEKMSIDLAGGMVADTEITGVRNV